jgi:hypothetical protein
MRSYMRLFVRRKARAARIQKMVVGRPGRNAPTQPRPKASHPSPATAILGQ